MNQPKFLCVGAAKAGTTSIQDVLSQHSKVFLPPEKEVHFFDDDDNYSKGLSWYQDFFKTAEVGELCGEITPAYMTYDFVPSRVKESLGEETKFIFLFRNPVSRAWSEYQHNSRRALVDFKDFEEGIKVDLESQDVKPFDKRLYSYMTRGFYSKQVELFLKEFPKEQLLFLSFEKDLIAQPKETYEKIQSFLGLEFETLDYELKSNSAYQPKSMTLQKVVFGDNPLRKFAKKLVPGVKTRRFIREKFMKANSSENAQAEKLDQKRQSDLFNTYFKEDAKKLSSLTGLDLGHWG